MTLLKAKYENWLVSDNKVKKLGVSLHYWLLRHRMWDSVMSLDPKSRFTEIYRRNLWNNEESRSGGGSTLRRTEKIRTGLQELVAQLGIKSICDAGCGDFNWMKAVKFGDVSYVGVDLVAEIIAINTERYRSDNVSFMELDIIRDDLPTVDLILCREVLFHLSFADLAAAIANFKRSGSKYLLATHFPDIAENTDIPTGRCRGLNLRKVPLDFPVPMRTIEEDRPGCCLALWKFEDIQAVGRPVELGKGVSSDSQR